jgi:hypothetical protein
MTDKLLTSEERREQLKEYLKKTSFPSIVRVVSLADEDSKRMKEENRRKREDARRTRARTEAK